MVSFLHRLVAAFTILLLALLGGGAWFYLAQKEHVRQEVERDLTSIAREKIDRIVTWREERIANACVLVEGPAFAGDVERYLAEPGPATARDIQARFASLRDHYQYSDAWLIDAQGQVRLSLSGLTGPMPDACRQALEAAMEAGTPLLTDLHAARPQAGPHISVIAPLFRGEGPNRVRIGAIVLERNPAEFLYPLIQKWPLPSRTAETLLVRLEGNDVLFLNELRHTTGTALTLRIPMAREDVPSVMAVGGKTGFVEGNDYRGKPVIAYVAPVPGSPWFMVSKVDRSEAFADWHFRSSLILTTLLGLVAVAGVAGVMVWQRGRNSTTATSTGRRPPAAPARNATASH